MTTPNRKATTPSESVSVPSTHSRIDVCALTASAVSAAGLLALVIGRIAGAPGFGSSDKSTSTFSILCFFIFLLALLIGVVTGAAAWWTGRRAGRRSGITAGYTAGSYLIIAIITAALLN
jgi:hypothetical protein